MCPTIRTDSLGTGAGGEFAFVVLSLSQRLGVLPEELNRLLIGVVVLSMALTPALSNLADYVSGKLTELAVREGMDQVGSGSGRPSRLDLCEAAWS